MGMEKASSSSPSSKKKQYALGREAIYVARFLFYLRGLPGDDRVREEDFLGFTAARTQDAANEAAAKMMVNLDAFLVGLIESNEGNKDKDSPLSPHTIKQTKDKILSFVTAYSTAWARKDTKGKVSSPFLTVKPDTPTFSTALGHYTVSVTTNKVNRTDVDKAVDHGMSFSPTTLSDLTEGVIAQGLSCANADVMAAFMVLNSTLCRGDEINLAKLCDLRVDKTGRRPDPVFSFMLRDISKSSRKGKSQYYGFLRHVNTPQECPVFWTGFYFFTQRFTAVDRPYPDFRTRGAWYDRPVFVARGAHEATLDRVQGLRRRAGALLEALGITFVEHQVLHALRKLGVLALELSRVDEHHAKRHGHWSAGGKDIKSEHYHPRFSHFALIAAAGVEDVNTEAYRCSRDFVFENEFLSSRLDDVMAELVEAGHFEVLRCFHWQGILDDQDHPYWQAEGADTTRHAARNFNSFAIDVSKVFVADLACLSASERSRLGGIEEIIEMASFKRLADDVAEYSELFELDGLSEASSMRAGQRRAAPGSLVQALERKVDEQNKTIGELSLKLDHLLSLVKLLHSPSSPEPQSPPEPSCGSRTLTEDTGAVVPDTPPPSSAPSGPSGPSGPVSLLPTVPTLREAASWERVVSLDLQGVIDARVSAEGMSPSHRKAVRTVRQRQAELRKCRSIIHKAARSSSDHRAIIKKAVELDKARREKGGMTLAQHMMALITASS